MELWELAARERVKDTLASHNWSGDALRLHDLAQAFCEDGELELRGHESVHGRYRDVFVRVDGDWLIGHRLVSTDWSAAESTMARR